MSTPELTVAKADTKVVAVVVTYEPVLEMLQLQWNALVPQVDRVVIVDNHSTVDVRAWMQCNNLGAGFVIVLEQNFGIAKAQNVGISWAREQGATHVLLMDQDSVLAPDMVQELLDAASGCHSLAALGPCYVDARMENPPPFIRMRGLRMERVVQQPGRNVVPVDYLIASGCLIPMAALNQVGLMREDLFIDYVDIEWGLRAKREGLQCFGVFSATMSHSLGETPYPLFGRQIPIHSPLRHYYHVRNAILLYREPWVPMNFKWVDGWRLLLKFGFYSLLTPPRLQHFLMMLRGFWHGIKGRAGPRFP
ncbi:MAG: glycosyltransferase family 2 protein [Rhodoferax sp.]|nr:glycosyltransferase family 2 protein [Rhodoferax sp.]